MSRLDRFKKAQDSLQTGFESALAEIRSGAKRGHWIWYVFPQIAGLGASDESRTFAIDGVREAEEFLRDSTLRLRLFTISEAVAQQLKRGKALRAVMGSDIDAKKIVSCLTLFGSVAKTLRSTESDAYSSLAALADEILAAAAADGYPRCRYTLKQIRQRP